MQCRSYSKPISIRDQLRRIYPWIFELRICHDQGLIWNMMHKTIRDVKNLLTMSLYGKYLYMHQSTAWGK